MNTKVKNTFRSAISFLLLLSIVVGFSSVNYADNLDNNDKKAIILILDETSLEDLTSYDLPNIKRLMDTGAIGLMNTRAKSSVNNMGSSYLSLGMGVRTLASTQGQLAFNRDADYPISSYDIFDSKLKAEDVYKLYTGRPTPGGDVVNLAIEDIKRVALDVTPNNRVGLLGETARENKLKIAVLGNADTDTASREFTMLAMDENGMIPYGNIDSDLLKLDKTVIGGVRSDDDKLLTESKRLLKDADLLFLNYGDTSRIQKGIRLAADDVKIRQKEKILKNADRLLGNIMEEVELDKTMFMIISPNPSTDMIKAGNFGLTPIVVNHKGLDSGLLTSTTTNRKGLVTNFDFSPTILNFFEVEKKGEFIGESMTSLDSEDSKGHLEEILSKSIYLRKYRTAFHIGFIVLIALNLLAYFIGIFTGHTGLKKLPVEDLSYMLFALPLTILTVSLFGYRHIVLDMAYVFLGSYLIARLTKKLLKNRYRIIACLSLMTAGLIVLDIFFLNKLMIISPLGSDAIAGGRFYGIGNDYMGLLLVSIILGMFSIYELKESKASTMVLSLMPVLFIAILALSPLFGANMGGTLSALGISLMALLIIFDREFSFKKLVGLGLIAVVMILLLATADAFLNPNPTHAGKAMEALLTGGGASKLIEIISIKLRQVFYNLFNSPWSILFFTSIGLILGLRRKKKDLLDLVKKDYSYSYKGFTIVLIGSLFIFLFNDTGTIAAAIVLSYMLVNFALLLEE